MAALKRLIVIILLALYASQFANALLVKTSRGDLGLVLDAAERLQSGAPLYDANMWHTHTKPPITTLAFVPLSQLPRYWAERVWDVFLVSCFLLFFRWAITRFPVQPGNRPINLWFLAFALTFNAWVAELVFGQFNLLLLAAAASAVFFSNSYVGGALFTFSLFFKPTQIVFAPWIWFEGRHKGKLVAGGLALMAALAVVYGVVFGWDRLVSDHLAWWAKTSGITPMHVNRPDNLGLASFFTTLGLTPAAWPWFQVLGIVAAGILTYRFRKLGISAFRSFAWVACFTILASPMAWRYVYVMVFPFAWMVWDAFLAGKDRADRWVLGLALMASFWGTQICNPEVAKISWLSWMFANRPPLLGLTASLLLTGGCFYASFRRKVELNRLS